MDKQPKLIDADKLLEWMSKQYIGFTNMFEHQIKAKIADGDFDPDPLPLPTIKPGDKVRIIDAMEHSFIGKEDIVTSISGSAPYSARLKESLGDWPLSSLEVSHD
ncbi:hypothetical protein RE628_11375 [Paenibacillus sp. D2_2]|uniref:hypothetical protein n=1 Tax=Paenibacillus sp. D2_2 TaxID=3073092 RepID=UPI002815A7B3|nr:hypothetical protein [Paenibacillus sp. D2_2]WMT42828.1 hypothetical protein RE628_11375 [Paenibacillus sp. D2_2]